ncbi:hypothetical protein RI367_004875 [Sorochytrium milnesiophthora]
MPRPTSSLSFDSWRKDINRLHHLGDSTTLVGMDLRRLAPGSVKWQSQRTLFVTNLAAMKEGRAQHERLLNEAESALSLPQAELTAWEDGLVKLAKQIHMLDSVRQELDSSQTASGAQDGGTPSGFTRTSQGRPRPLSLLPDDGGLLSFPPPRVGNVSQSQRRDSTVVTPGYTDNTAPQQLLQLQRRVFDDQDSHLDELAGTLQRQKHIGITMNDELDTQMGLLTELDTNVTRADSRLRSARKRLDQVSQTAKANGHWVLIIVLVIIFIIVLSI